MLRGFAGGAEVKRVRIERGRKDVMGRIRAQRRMRIVMASFEIVT